MTETPEDSKLTKTKSKWAELGKFLTGMTARQEDARLPPRQHLVRNWPVLDLGQTPNVRKEVWRLDIAGAVEHPASWTWHDFVSAPQSQKLSDIHCVTTWSRYDMRWRGVRFAELAALAGVHDNAEHVLCHAYDGYTTNLPLVEALKDDVLIAFEVDGQPLPREHGGPARMITPQLYAWKGAKWISKIEFRVEDRPGFWEERGYSNSAHPWREDRYS